MLLRINAKLEPCFKISRQKESASQKSQEGWPLTFYLKFEYEVKILYIQYICGYGAIYNGF